MSDEALVLDLARRLSDLEDRFRRHKHDNIETDALDIGVPESLTDLPGILPVTQGGTGADNASDARDNLGIAAPAWSLVSYSTEPTANNITISGLDLDTDLQYQIIIAVRNVTAGGVFSAQLNSDSGANKHHWSVQGHKLSNGEDNNASDTDTAWQLSHSSGDMSMHCSMLLSYNSGSPLATWNTAATGFSGNVSARVSSVNGAGYWDDSANVTSIKFAFNNAVTCQWKVWVLKANTV